MEASLYPQSTGLILKKDLQADRIDFQESDDKTQGDYMFYISLNDEKGHLRIYLSSKEAQFFAKTMLMIAALASPDNESVEKPKNSYTNYPNIVDTT